MLKINNTRMQDSLKGEYTPAESMMFMEQPRPHFLPSSRQPAINLARKDTAIVFQIYSALYDIIWNTDNKLNQLLVKFKNVPLKNSNLKRRNSNLKKLKRVFIYV